MYQEQHVLGEDESGGSIESLMAETVVAHSLPKAGSSHPIYLRYQFGDIIRRQRFGNEKALDGIATRVLQQVFLGVGFHAFGDDFQSKAVAERDDAVADLGIAVIGFDVVNEGAIDFQTLNG